ncbi:MAG: PilZ domain-containing protein [Candidatus Omnitrophica bacterium]|nr:PilZ domain-containing protein [Candidatus Omnitrophota bacterium]
MQNKKSIGKGAERRKFPRASARIIYAVVKNEQYLGNEVHTKDISLGGIGFTAKECLAQDEILSFDIAFPQGKTFVVQGKVIRVDPIAVTWSHKKEYKIGVMFIDLTLIAQEYIQEYLARLTSSQAID